MVYKGIEAIDYSNPKNWRGLPEAPTMQEPSRTYTDLQQSRQPKPSDIKIGTQLVGGKVYSVYADAQGNAFLGKQAFGEAPIITETQTSQTKPTMTKQELPPDFYQQELEKRQQAYEATHGMSYDIQASADAQTRLEAQRISLQQKNFPVSEAVVPRKNEQQIYEELKAQKQAGEEFYGLRTNPNPMISIPAIIATTATSSVAGMGQIAEQTSGYLLKGNVPATTATILTLATAPVEWLSTAPSRIYKGEFLEVSAEAGVMLFGGKILGKLGKTKTEPILKYDFGKGVKTGITKTGSFEILDTSFGKAQPKYFGLNYETEWLTGGKRTAMAQKVTFAQNEGEMISIGKRLVEKSESASKQENIFIGKNDIMKSVGNKKYLLTTGDWGNAYSVRLTNMFDVVKRTSEKPPNILQNYAVRFISNKDFLKTSSRKNYRLVEATAWKEKLTPMEIINLDNVGYPDNVAAIDILPSTTGKSKYFYKKAAPSMRPLVGGKFGLELIQEVKTPELVSKPVAIEVPLSTTPKIVSNIPKIVKLPVTKAAPIIDVSMPVPKIKPLRNGQLGAFEAFAVLSANQKHPFEELGKAAQTNKFGRLSENVHGQIFENKYTLNLKAAQRQEHKQGTAQITAALQLPKQKPLQIQKPKQMQRLTQIQIPRQAQKQNYRQLYRQNYKTKQTFINIPTITKPPYPPYSPPFNSPSAGASRSPSKYGSGLVMPYIRRRGKWKALTRFPVPLEQAKHIGVRAVKGGLGASFSIKGLASNNLGLSKEFYLKKEKIGNVFIQRPSFRISSRGEKREIQAARTAKPQTRNIFQKRKSKKRRIKIM